MKNSDFEIGDSVYHKSNPSVLWTIEKIEGNEAYCSTIIKNTLEQKKEKLSLTSIIKYEPPQVRMGKLY